MAVYKVPQDVEADDKLIGPFSFRQFIYLIVVAIAGFIAYILSQIFIALALIPLPIMIFFGAIALPLRKDQPMELYLLALVQFYLKPKQRLWQPEGAVTMVEITAPKINEISRVKDFSSDEAINRLDYLAQVMDTRGWATRGASLPQDDASGNGTIAAQPASTAALQKVDEPEDILDTKAPVAQTFDKKIDEQKIAYREEIAERIEEEVKRPEAHNKHQKKSGHAKSTKPEGSHKKKHENPFNSAWQESISEKPSAETVSPDIINLANNNDFTVATLAHEAKRIREREEQEVTILIPHKKR